MVPETEPNGKQRCFHHQQWQPKGQSEFIALVSREANKEAVAVNGSASRQTTAGAQVALQQSPILLMCKAKNIIAKISTYIGSSFIFAIITTLCLRPPSKTKLEADAGKSSFRILGVLALRDKALSPCIWTCFVRGGGLTPDVYVDSSERNIQVADALPDDIDSQHPERLKFIRDLLHFFLFSRKFF